MKGVYEIGGMPHLLSRKFGGCPPLDRLHKIQYTLAPGFTRGKRYTYPHGDSAQASHCLQGCLSRQGMAPAGSLNRGSGHLPVMQTAPGINGLYDMGGAMCGSGLTPPGETSASHAEVHGGTTPPDNSNRISRLNP